MMNEGLHYTNTKIDNDGFANKTCGTQNKYYFIRFVYPYDDIILGKMFVHSSAYVCIK